MVDGRDSLQHAAKARGVNMSLHSLDTQAQTDDTRSRHGTGNEHEEVTAYMYLVASGGVSQSHTDQLCFELSETNDVMQFWNFDQGPL